MLQSQVLSIVIIHIECVLLRLASEEIDATFAFKLVDLQGSTYSAFLPFPKYVCESLKLIKIFLSICFLFEQNHFITEAGLFHTPGKIEYGGSVRANCFHFARWPDYAARIHWPSQPDIWSCKFFCVHRPYIGINLLRDE